MPGGERQCLAPGRLPDSSRQCQVPTYCADGGPRLRPRNTLHSTNAARAIVTLGSDGQRPAPGPAPQCTAPGTGTPTAAKAKYPKDVIFWCQASDLQESPGQMFLGSDGKLPAWFRPPNCTVPGTVRRPLFGAWHRSPQQLKQSTQKRQFSGARPGRSWPRKVPVPCPGRQRETEDLFEGSCPLHQRRPGNYFSAPTTRFRRPKDTARRLAPIPPQQLKRRTQKM